MADLEEINNNVIKAVVKIENIENTITEMKNDRKETSKEFWNNINTMNNKINKLTTKMAVMSVGITTTVTLAIAWVRSQFK